MPDHMSNILRTNATLVLEYVANGDISNLLSFPYRPMAEKFHLDASWYVKAFNPGPTPKLIYTWAPDHCIDFIRQTIQCQADLTPMKWYWSDAVNQIVLKRESLHTCRKWDNIQQWAMERIHIQTEEEKKKTPLRPTHGSWSPLG
jgi:hypothetical protein